MSTENQTKMQQNSTVDFPVRPMTNDDLLEVKELFRESGWIIGANSVDTWFKLDPKGWKVMVTGSGEVIGVCSAAQLTDDFYQLKYYFVKKQYRGLGLGLKLWNSCMEYIGTENVCLKSAANMVDNYKSKSGFCFLDNDPVIDYGTRGHIQTENLSDELPEGVSLVSFQDSHLTAMVEYDPFNGTKNGKRRRIIELTCKEKNSKTLVAFKNGACVGFGTVKITLLNNLTVRPMYADDVKIAEVMLKKLIQSFPNNEGLYMRTFASNKATSDIMEKINCFEDSRMYHMYSKTDYRLLNFKSSVHKLFGILEYDLLLF